LADKGGAAQISTAMRVRAEIIASDVSLLVTFNHAINSVIQNNPKARANPKAQGNRTDTRIPQSNKTDWQAEAESYQTRQKQRERCAWSRSRRGQCESDRGAPNLRRYQK